MDADAMSQANVQQAVPFFAVADIEASVRWYVGGLGFDQTAEWVVDGRLRWCWLKLGDAALMLQEYETEGPPASPPPGKAGEGVTVYFICRDALAIYREITGRGVEASRPFVGNRMWVTYLRDPDGYRLAFESPTEVAEGTEHTAD
ncbi:MAG: VOC family protein [Gemmatimonadota bacterium]